MKKKLLSIIWIALLLSACNVPSNSPATGNTTPDVVATEVQKILTQMPTATAAPDVAPTQTPPAPTKSSGPAPTRAPTFTSAPQPTTAPVAGDPASTLGKPAWTDKLDNAKNFYTYDNENTEIKQSDGALVLLNLTNIGWHGWSLTYVQAVTDGYLQGTFKTEGCGDKDLYGLAFHADKDNAGYFFGITCDGQYNLWARDFNNGTNTEIRGYQHNTAILTGSGQQNRLGVMTTGSKISLYVNGTLLEELNDETFTKGYFGPFIAGVTPNFSVRLDEISLWNTN